MSFNDILDFNDEEVFKDEWDDAWDDEEEEDVWDTGIWSSSGRPADSVWSTSDSDSGSSGSVGSGPPSLDGDENPKELDKSDSDEDFGDFVDLW